MELRDYQSRAVEQLRQAYLDGHDGAILELGTGAGKTVTAVSVCASAVQLGGWVLWLAHRRELLEQAAATMRQLGLAGAIISKRIELATVQSLARQLDRQPDIEAPAVIVVDEGHRALAAGYRKIFARWPSAFRVLLTGTAWRSDKQDFGPVASTVVRGPTVGELTDAGWLVPACYWSIPGVDLSGVKSARGDYRSEDLAAAFDRPKLVGDVADTYQRLAGDRRGVVFASGVQHARHIAAELRARGIVAKAVHGDMLTLERESALVGHLAGSVQVLTCAELLIEGWDNPAVSCVSFARATQSEIVWRQAIGRGLRLAAGKRDCVVLDHGGNVHRLGDVADRLEYQPTGDGPRASRRDTISLITCSQCWAVLPSRPRPESCTRCGAELPVSAKQAPEQTSGELVHVSTPQRQAKPAVDWKIWRTIEAERRAKGYKPGWTWAQYGLRSGLQQWKQNQEATP